MRIHGVDNIAPAAARPATTRVNGKILTTLQIRTPRRQAGARRARHDGGRHLVVHLRPPCRGCSAAAQPNLKLANPIAADMSDMRPSLLPGLIAAAQRNADKRHGDVALFEVSGTYRGRYARRPAAACRRRAARHGAGSKAPAATGPATAKPVGVFDAKADALAVLEACGAPVDKLQIEAGGPAWYHPGRSGTIKLGPKTVLGAFRRIPSQDAGSARRSSGPLCRLRGLSRCRCRSRRPRPTRTKPKLELSPSRRCARDFAFVVDRAVEAGALVTAAAAADRKLITGVSVFDVFEGASLGEDKKSIAIEVADPAGRQDADRRGFRGAGRAASSTMSASRPAACCAADRTGTRGASGSPLTAAPDPLTFRRQPDEEEPMFRWGVLSTAKIAREQLLPAIARCRQRRAIGDRQPRPRPRRKALADRFGARACLRLL